MAVSVRTVAKSDVPAILSIYQYHVRESVASFLIKRPPIEYIQTRLDASVERGLPYLVAVVKQDSGDEKVVGYACASAFRGFMLGYGHTVELTIFCHPDHLNQGAGSAMMKTLLQRLRETRHISREASKADEPEEFEVKQVLAVMSVDDAKEDKGLGLRDWYIKWGFEEVGHLRNVGYKHGRWHVLTSNGQRDDDAN